MNLLQEQASYIISNEGSRYCYFLFSGNPESKRRMSNFAHNYNVTAGAVEEYNDEYSYFLAPISKLKSKLLELFSNEIIQSKDAIDYAIAHDDEGGIINVSWCEQKVAALAQGKLDEFFSRVEFKSMFSSFERAVVYAEYAIGSYSYAEPELLTA